MLGRTAVVTRAPDGQVYTSYETATGSDVFGDWTVVNNSSNLAVTDPTVALFTNGSNQT